MKKISLILVSIMVLTIGVLYFSTIKYNTSNVVNNEINEEIAFYVNNEPVSPNVNPASSGATFDKAVCTNGATATWDSTAQSLKIAGVSGPTSCKVYFTK